MRKLILFCALLSFQDSFAQLDKTTWLLGGDLSYNRYKNSYSSNDFTKQRHLEAALNKGYFVLDKLALGVRGSVLNFLSILPANLNGSGREERYRHTYLKVGPFARYYFLTKKSPVNLFADASSMYGWSSNNANDITEKSWTTTGAAGTAIFLNQNIGLELMLAYQQINFVGTDSKTNRLQFNVGFQVHFAKANRTN